MPFLITLGFVGAVLFLDSVCVCVCPLISTFSSISDRLHPLIQRETVLCLIHCNNE